MKKNLLIIVFLVFGFAAQAQFKLGINAGVPVGDVSDFYSFSAGADAYYMFAIRTSFSRSVLLLVLSIILAKKLIS
jgi:uncharacterized membrane protein